MDDKRRPKIVEVASGKWKNKKAPEGWIRVICLVAEELLAFHRSFSEEDQERQFLAAMERGLEELSSPLPKLSGKVWELSFHIPPELCHIILAKFDSIPDFFTAALNAYLAELMAGERLAVR